MKKFLIIFTIFLFTINTATARTLFINADNGSTITLKEVQNAIKHGAKINARSEGIADQT